MICKKYAFETFMTMYLEGDTRRHKLIDLLIGRAKDDED